MKVSIGAASFALISATAVSNAQTAYPRVFTPGMQSDYAPPVDVWLDAIRYDYGDRLRPYFASEPGAYVTIVRVSTDGVLRVLYPLRPGLQEPYRLGELPDDRVPVSGSGAFDVYESSGTGFVFALASYERFDFRYYTSGGSWNLARLASTGRLADPFEVVRRFINQILDDRGEYSMDYVSYEVESSRQRSRYASRYRNYGYDDYYHLCVSAFDAYYAGYCGIRYGGGNYGAAYNGGYYGEYYGGGYYGGGYYAPSSAPLVIRRRPPVLAPGSHKKMRIRPVVPDPMMPHNSAAVPMEGRLHVNDPREAAFSRRGRMQREEPPRLDMKSDVGRAQSGPRIYSEPMVVRPAPRVEPRAQAPAPAAVYSQPRQQPAVGTLARPQRDNQRKQ
jgi:hypothetical protein